MSNGMLAAAALTASACLVPEGGRASVRLLTVTYGISAVTDQRDAEDTFIESVAGEDVSPIRWQFLALASAVCIALGISLGFPAWVVVVATAAAGIAARRRSAPKAEIDGLDLAAALDGWAAALRAGLVMPAALELTAGAVTGSARRALLAAASLHRLGASPADAWEPLHREPLWRNVAGHIRHSSRSGAPIASVLTEAAESERSAARDRAAAAGERAAVYVAGPLGLCFLPAFICLGIVPVIIGLAGEVLGGPSG